MAVTLDRQELLRLARLGAELRLQALERERAYLLSTFPGISGASGASTAARVPAAAPARRTRSRMSAAERKAVSLRMKRYWAERRKAKAGATSKRA
jgi:hypothetical protein